ncbi:MAG TPA: ribonuclease III domain-containing protein [Bacillota bacterium]|nr:ribonuclease III domain-containing protein [Bacillota bacterium]
MDERSVRNMNTMVLAYLGDAVYESFIRVRLMDSKAALSGKALLLHRAGVRYVNASAQANALSAIRPRLSETEEALVLRARNHRTAAKAKNADIVTYKRATALEALFGYLYLSGQNERLSELMEAAAAATEAGEPVSR